MQTIEELDEIPALETSGKPKAGPRILILYSDIGEGHLSAARTLRDEIVAEEPAAKVVLDNGVNVLGWFLCWFMRDFYRANLANLPRLYRFTYELVRRVWVLRALGALILSLLGGRAELRLVLSHSPDLVISTDARLNAVLGHLKRAGKLRVPVFATLTDLGGLEFWTHKGVDLHLVMDSSCVGPVERLAGRDAARQVRPLVAPAFFGPLTRAQARDTLGLPPDDKVVLVSGGGWGVGDLEGAVRTALTLPGTLAICLTGRNDQVKKDLESLFSDEPRVQVLGFTSQMNELIAACDAVVHSTGGVTYLEALVRGRPVIAYRPPAGHPALIAEILAKQGRQRMALTQPELREALLAAFSQAEEDAVEIAVPSAASAIFGAVPRVKPRPAWQAWGARVVAVTTLVMMMAGYAFLGDEPFPVMARALHLGSAPLSSGPTSVGLVIQTSPDIVPKVVTELAAYGDTASLAVVGDLSGSAANALQRSGNEVLVTLQPASLIGGMHTRRSLARGAASLGVGRPAVYLPPGDGFSLSEYLLARRMGALPVRGATRLESSNPGLRLSAKAGSLLVIDLDSSPTDSIAFLDGVLAALKDKGLVGVPLEPDTSL
jgi:processive 1,2-diacylglycerol beta-glucosyltransferase